MKSLCIVAYSDYLTDARVIRYAESSIRAGYVVDVITPRIAGQEARFEMNGVTVHRMLTQHYSGAYRIRYLLSYFFFFFLCLIQIARLHIEKTYQTILVCNIPDFLVFSTVVAKMSGTKIILDIHDPLPYTYMAKFPGKKKGVIFWLALLQERLSAAYSDAVITVSEPVKRDILVRDGIPAAKISVIRNFADERIFRKSQEYRIELPIRILYYGTISSRFGLDNVLTAISNVRHKDRLFFKIIGKGDGEKALLAKIKSTRLGSFVEFDNSYYPLRQLPAIIRSFHLGLVPYSPSPATDYMMPVKFLELLAMGIPSITIPNKPIRYYFHEQLYFAYNPMRLETLTSLIDQILDDPTLILSKRAALLKESSLFLWKNECRNFFDLLSLLSK